MADPPVGSPLAERDFGDELGLDPVPAHVARLLEERRLVARDPVERLLDRAQRLLVEAGADAAGEAQMTGLVVDAEQERADPVRDPCGSVHPPTTNSCRCVHLSLIQVALRRTRTAHRRAPQIEQLLGFRRRVARRSVFVVQASCTPTTGPHWNAHFAPTCTTGEPFRPSTASCQGRPRRLGPWLGPVVRDDQGEPLFLQGIAFDITRSRKPKRSANRFFSLALDLLCVLGLDGYYKRVNPAFTGRWAHRGGAARPAAASTSSTPTTATRRWREMPKLARGNATLIVSKIAAAAGTARTAGCSGRPRLTCRGR